MVDDYLDNFQALVSNTGYMDPWMLVVKFQCGVMPLENFLQKCNMEYILYPWVSLLESTLEISYKPQT